jgi:hypothetical protein
MSPAFVLTSNLKKEVRDEHLGQIKEVSTNVPTDNKFEVYQQISYG